MSRHNKIQKPSFGNNSTPKKSGFLHQANSWRNPYQESNAEASEQPINTVKPPTTEEWLKDNIMLRAIETRQAQLQKQQLEENSNSEQQLEPTSTTPLEAIQAKLTVGAPGDKYEQEADQMAEQVMSMEAPTVQQQSIQRQDEELSESIQKQPLSASITPLVQRFAEAKGQAKSNKEPLFTSKESYRESIQLKALQAKHIDKVNVSPNFQAKWLDNRFHTVEPTTKEQPIQRQSEELAQPIQRNSFDATITPYIQCLTKVIQRLNEDKLQAKASPSLESRLASQTGGGSPLDEQTRSFMEPRFGADFNKVRVHTDTTAVQMNKELGAKAFAHGSDVYFGEGQSPGKNQLTAHELTHVVQQGGAVRMKQETLRPQKLEKQKVSAKSNKEPSLFTKQDNLEVPKNLEKQKVSVNSNKEPSFFTKQDNLESAQLKFLQAKHFQQSNSQDISKHRNKQAIQRQAKTAPDNKGNSKLSVSSMSYPEKLVAAAKMVPDMLAGDAKAAFQKLISDPAFISQLVAVGAAFAALQAIPFVGEIIDAALIAYLGFTAGWSLISFLTKAWLATDEKSLRSAAVELKNLVEIVGIAAITGILRTAGRALRAIKGNPSRVTSSARNPGTLGKIGQGFQQRARGISQIRIIQSSVSILKKEFNESYLATLTPPMRTRYELLIEGVQKGILDLRKPSVSRRFLILKRVKELRTDLSKAVSSQVGKELELGQHNIAYGSYKITLPNGKIISGDFISVSGKNVSKIITEQVGTSFKKKNIIPEINRVNKKLGRFKVTRKGGDHDSERKLFEYLLNEMEKLSETHLEVGTNYQNRGFSGKIVVNSEMTPCYSCEEIMKPQFQRMFGKDIQVYVHGGVDYP